MKLSEYLQGLDALNNEQIHAVLVEIAVRLEVIEKERIDDLSEACGGLCTCPVGRRSGASDKHVAYCPQAREDGI